MTADPLRALIEKWRGTEGGGCTGVRRACADELEAALSHVSPTPPGIVLMAGNVAAQAMLAAAPAAQIVSASQAESVGLATFLGPAQIHPDTLRLVENFAGALASKLAQAERKYGYTDGWKQGDWMDECREKLLEHVAKGDPRDVAAYCAFLWHHGERTAAAPVAQESSDNANVPHLIFYDDHDRRPEIFIGDGAEEVARYRFAQVWDHWNCHLFAKVASSSRDDEQYGRNYTAAAPAVVVDEACPYGEPNCSSCHEGPNCRRCSTDIVDDAMIERACLGKYGKAVWENALDSWRGSERREISIILAAALGQEVGRG